MPEKPTVVAVGELLWDLLPSGPQFGGAPGNFAHHAASLGAAVSMVSAVGDDDLGHQAIAELKKSNLDLSHVSILPHYPTGAVDVSLDDAGHASYQFRDDEAWDHLPWSEGLQSLAADCDVVCFGSLGQRHAESRATIRKLVEGTSQSALRVFDINLRPPHYDEALIQQSIEMANVLKLNDDELHYIAGLYGHHGSELEQGSEVELTIKLVTELSLRLIAVTRGSRGSLLVGEGQISEVDSQPVVVQDTVGAGDSFTAALAIGLHHQLPLDVVNEKACRIAEYVCSHSGATPELPAELRY